MTLAPTLPTRRSESISLERCLSRMDELLVGRTNTPEWWTSLERAVDEMGRAFDDPTTRGASLERMDVASVTADPHLAFGARRLDRDHDEVAHDIAELRQVVVGCPREPSGLALALTSTTEVVARIRGYQRRLSAMLHQVQALDLAEPA
jgi:hypothetical protein